MINSINIEAFELVKLVSRKPKEEPKESIELAGSIKERGFNDWSDKVVGNMRFLFKFLLFLEHNSTLY